MQGDGTQTRCGSIAGFQIGDFVWGKIDGNLWWPGQVCDPSDASEQPRHSEHVDGHLLVAYFGDNTFAWCEGSLLKPFKEEFQQMVEQNRSLSFVDAVNEAMFEVERCLRSDMTCYCVPPEKIVQFRIDRKSGIGNTSVGNYSPASFLDHLQDVAQDVSVANLFDVTLLRSWAASFYLRNGCFVKMIENLFDEKQTNLNSLAENSYKDKQGRAIRMTGGRAVRRPQVSREEASRKKRSIAELILVSDPDMVEEEKIGAFGEETRGINQKKKRRGKERDKATDVEVNKVVNEEENGFTRRERKKSKYLSPPYTNAYREQRSNSFKTVDSGTSENESESSLNLQIKFPDGYEEPRKDGDPLTRSSIYTESSTHDILGKLLFAACNPLHKGRNTPVETVREFILNYRNFTYSGVLELDHLSGDSGSDEMVIDFNKVTSRRKQNNGKDESEREAVLGLNREKENVKKDQVTTETPMSDSCLNGVVSSAGRLRNRRKRGTDEAVSGSVEEMDHMSINCIKEGRREDKKNKTRGVVNDGIVGESINENFISSRHKKKSNANATNGQRKMDDDLDNSGKNVLGPKRTKLVEGSNENSVALLLTFAPGSTLPSKDELLVVFSKYGALIKHETELFRDPGCARVVFARGTDAKKAMNGIQKSNNFPFSVVDWQSFDLPQSPGIPLRSESDPNAELVCISQDLQKMVHTLSPKKGLASHGLKPDVAKDLINDIKGLLNKVNKFIT